MLFIQLIFIVRDNLASRMDIGSVSALTYGWMFFQMPETLIGTAIGTAMLPGISELAAKKDWKEFAKTIEKAIQTLIALTLPVAAVMSAGLAELFLKHLISLLNKQTLSFGDESLPFRAGWSMHG
jgi:putative peptidoglycan lipid II flippase